MEDQEPKRKKAPRSHQLNIMVVRGLGRVRNFNVSSRLLFWSFLFFLCYILVSIFIINDYLENYWEGVTQEERLNTLQRNLENTKKELHRSQQRLALLEGYDGRSDSEVQLEKKVSTAVGIDPKEGEPVTGPSPDEKKDQEAVRGPLVEIQDLRVLREGSKFKVQFKVVNLGEGDSNPLRGYVHTIAVNGSAVPPQFWTYPREDLQDGIPKDYKSGERFMIKNFRTIRGEYPLSSPPSSLRVLVYDEEGNLLLVQDFDTEG